MLRHNDLGVALNDPGRLDRLDGRESPARTARGLILNGSAVTGIAVVISGREVRDIDVRDGL